jgi:hypothetical protein
MINGCGAIVGMRISRGSRSAMRKLTPLLLVYHKFHMIGSGIEPGQPRWEADD